MWSRLPELPSRHTPFDALKEKLKHALLASQACEHSSAFSTPVIVLIRFAGLMVKPATGPWKPLLKHTNVVLVEVTLVDVLVIEVVVLDTVVVVVIETVVVLRVAVVVEDVNVVVVEVTDVVVLDTVVVVLTEVVVDVRLDVVLVTVVELAVVVVVVARQTVGSASDW